jgi:hypothetical protein
MRRQHDSVWSVRTVCCGLPVCGATLMATLGPVDAASILDPLARGLLSGGTQSPDQWEDFNNRCQ